MYNNILKLFLRLSLGLGFLSAVGDRFGTWPKKVSTWGNWESFLSTTRELIPVDAENIVIIFAVIATAAEIILGIFLIAGIKTKLTAQFSGVLLFLFGLAMAYSYGIKAPLDYSVFAASAAAFSLSTMKNKFLEIV